MATRTPAQRLALEALPDGGSVLDVGCGAGAGSLPLAPPAGLIIGVDEGENLLRAFGKRARERGVEHVEMLGRWPEIADRVAPADVVVCHNVFFNVPDLHEFATRLTDHAHRRVVVVSTFEHPLGWLRPLWQELHDWAPPSAPTIDEAVAVLEELGYDVGIERWTDTSLAGRVDADDLVVSTRKRLCLPPHRDGDVRAALDAHPPPGERELVALWWDGTAG